MWMLYCILVLYICEVTLVDGRSSNWLNVFIKNTVQRLRPYQLTLFVNSDNKVIEEKDIVQRIIKRVPTVAVDLSKIEEISNIRSLTLPVFKNPRHVTLYVVLHSAINCNDSAIYLQRVIDFFDKLSPNSLRPKCLLLIFDIISEDYLKLVLEYAWFKKFLDFSILTVGSYPLIYNYNPFYKQFTSKHFCSNDDILPYKLLNVNGFTLKVPAFDADPSQMTIRDKKGAVTGVRGLYFPLVKIALEVANFTIDFTTDLKNSTTSVILNKTFEGIVNGNLNMLLVPGPREFLNNTPYKNVILTLDVGYIYESVVAVTPITFYIEIKTTLLIMSLILVIPLILVCCTNVIRLLKIQYRYVNVLDIFRLFLGTTVAVQPKKLADRIIFLSIVFVSTTFSVDFFLQLMNENVIQEEISLDTFREISESSLDIYISHTTGDRAFNSNDKYVQQVKQKAIVTNFSSKCYNLLLRNRSAICIISTAKAHMLVDGYRDENGSAIVKIAKPIFSSERWVYFFEPASPYYERFNQILQRIFESGLWPFIKERINNVEIIKFNDQSNGVKRVMTIQLLIVLGTGYIVSTLIFFIEIVFKKVHLHRLLFCLNKG